MLCFSHIKIVPIGKTVFFYETKNMNRGIKMKIQKKGKKKKNDLKIVIGVVGGSTIFVFLFYVAISIYFSSHFLKIL